MEKVVDLGIPGWMTYEDVWGRKSWNSWNGKMKREAFNQLWESSITTEQCDIQVMQRMK